MHPIVRNTLAIVLAGALFGCGGGGGGGGSARGGSAETGVRLVHAAIDAAPAQVFTSLSPGLATQSARFGQIVPFAELPRGAQTIEVRRSASDVLFSSPVEVEGSQQYSILLYESASDFSPRFTLVLDPETETPAGTAAVRVAHAAIGAASISAVSDNGEAVASNVPYGSFSEYSPVSVSTTTRVSFIRDVDGRVIHSAPRQFAEGRSYTLVLSGQIDYFLTAPQLEDR